MKVLLIQPPLIVFHKGDKKCNPPLGLAYLVAAIAGRHDVAVLDAVAEGYEKETVYNNRLIYGLSPQEIIQKISYYAPDVIGISCFSSSEANNVHRLCGNIKKTNPKAVIVLGGAHPSSLPENVLRDSNIDFVVLGEGERPLNQLLDSLNKKQNLFDIEGIGFRHNGGLRINHRHNYEDDIDRLNFPKWNLFPLEKYFEINNPHGSPAKKIPFLPIITSRGCPFECGFCSIHNVWGRNYRARSIENVLTELEYVKNKFGAKEILFEDDNLTFDRQRADGIFNGIIERNLNLIWSTPNGLAVQALDDSLLETMKKSGCYRISIGVESADEHILRNMVNKPITFPKVKAVVSKSVRIGLEISAFFVVGLPGETPQSLNKTFRFAEGLGVDYVNFFFATPLPGTRLFDICRKNGLDEEKLDYSLLDSRLPNFSTGSFSKSEIYSAVTHEQIKINLIYLIRNPLKFFIKIINKLNKDPGYLARKISYLFAFRKGN